MTVQFHATDVRFAGHEDCTGGAVKVFGRITGIGDPFEICVWLYQTAPGTWTAFRWEGFRLNHRLPAVREMMAKIVRHCANILTVTAMHMKRQEDGSGDIHVGINGVLDEPDIKSFGAHRAQLAGMTIYRWQGLWDRISERNLHDLDFQITGYSRQQIATALGELRIVFPESWVQAQNRRLGALHLSAPIDPTAQEWFPAYHIARAAHGSLCVDVAWNYLIDIGLALAELREYDGAERVRRSLARSKGSRHHVCLAAEFHERGHLIALEPQMPGSTCFNDLEIAHDGQRFHIELKEISAQTDITKISDRIQREIRAKHTEVPKGFDLPLIMHFVALGHAETMIAAEAEIVSVLQDLKDIPPSISAVVTSSRSVSFDGGRPHTATRHIRTNDNANHGCDDQQISDLFASSRPALRSPSFGLMASTQFETRQPHQSGSS